MAHVKGITLILICICIMQHFLQVSAQAKKGEKNGKGKGRQKQQRLPSRPTISPRDQNKGVSKDPGDNSALFKGRFAKKDGMRCTWAATGGNVENDGAFVLGISCKKGAESFHCEYTAKPRSCPQYASSVDVYWKQISRSMKKQKKLCRDPKALLKAGVCKKAPKDAHFTLNTTPKVRPTPGRRNKPCPNLANRQKLAEEYCSSSWSSICTFFFAMVENDDC